MRKLLLRQFCLVMKKSSNLALPRKSAGCSGNISIFHNGLYYLKQNYMLSKIVLRKVSWNGIYKTGYRGSYLVIIILCKEIDLMPSCELFNVFYSFVFMIWYLKCYISVINIIFNSNKFYYIHCDITLHYK